MLSIFLPHLSVSWPLGLFFEGSNACINRANKVEVTQFRYEQTQSELKTVTSFFLAISYLYKLYCLQYGYIPYTARTK